MIQTTFAIIVFAISGFALLAMGLSFLAHGGVILEPRAAREFAKPGTVTIMLLIFAWSAYSAWVLM